MYIYIYIYVYIIITISIIIIIIIIIICIQATECSLGRALEAEIRQHLALRGEDELLALLWMST